MRILLVEDNLELGTGIEKILGKSYAVDRVTNGEYALSSISVHTYDLVILDLGLPDIDGLEVLKEIRNRKNSTPIIILTARDELNDRITGLDFGADDYMTKPFEFVELEARVRALLRRGSMEKTSVLEFGKLKLDMKDNSVFSDIQIIDMTPREVMVLRALMAGNGRLLNKAQLLASVTNFEENVSENAIEQYISRVRKKIAPHGVTVHAARGLGYHLREVD